MVAGTGAVEPARGPNPNARAPAPSAEEAGGLIGVLPVGAARIRHDAEIVAVNEAWESVTGIDQEHALGSAWLDHLDVLQRSVVESELDRAARAGERGSADWRIGGRWTRWWWHPSRGAGDDGELIVCVADIDDDKSREGELWYRATHDPLTGVLNRSEFIGLLERALDRRSRTGRAMAVIFADLVGFKQVNDRDGHRAGDEVLCIVARRLDDVIRPADVLARVGGDEFAVLCEDLGRCSEAEDVAERLRSAVESIGTDDTSLAVPLQLSTGIAMALDGDRPEDVLARADTAMYAGRGLRQDPDAAPPVVDLRDGTPNGVHSTPGDLDGDQRATVAHTLIHRIHGVCLQLAAATSIVDGEAEDRLRTAIGELDELMRDVRRQVFSRMEAPQAEPGDAIDSAIGVLADVEDILASLWVDIAADRGRADIAHRLLEASKYVHRAVGAITPGTVR